MTLLPYVVTTTGWLPDPDHGWCYSHAGGLITAHGQQDSLTSWPQPIQRLHLADPTTDAGVLRADLQRAVLPLLGVTPGSAVGAELLAVVFAAALTAPPALVVVRAPRCSGSSLLATTLAHHYGPTLQVFNPGVDLAHQECAHAIDVLRATSHALLVLDHATGADVALLSQELPGRCASTALVVTHDPARVLPGVRELEVEDVDVEALADLQSLQLREGRSRVLASVLHHRAAHGGPPREAPASIEEFVALGAAALLELAQRTGADAPGMAMLAELAEVTR